MADYNSYFSISDVKISELKKIDRQDIYREKLNSATNNELIEIALERNNLYNQANILAYERAAEIKELQTELQTQKNLTNHYNDVAYKSKVVCLSTIAICSFCILFFYIYQYIKYRLRKYADKIRSETIEEINQNR